MAQFDKIKGSTVAHRQACIEHEKSHIRQRFGLKTFLVMIKNDLLGTFLICFSMGVALAIIVLFLELFSD